MVNRWKRASVTLAPTLKAITSQDLGDAKLDYNYCHTLLSKPSSQTYAALNKWLKECSSEWLDEFLDCNALQTMFATLSFMGMKENAKFADAVIELQIIAVVKTILNSKVGMTYLIDDQPVLMQEMIFGNTLPLT